MGNHRASVPHIHQYAMPGFVLSRSTFEVEVFVFYEVLLHLDQLLSQLLEHSLCSCTSLVHCPVTNKTTN